MSIWKKIFRWMKVLYFIFYSVAMILLVGALVVTIIATMQNREAISNNATVNYIGLFIGLLSAPGILMQLISLLFLNTKQEYVVTTPCPKCRHKVDLVVKER